MRLAALLAALATYHQDVAPILERHCVTCHRGGGIGPMPLGTYQETRPWAKAIRDAVVSRKMPPWFVEKASRPLANDPSLTAIEIQTIKEWVENNGPEGRRVTVAPIAFPVEAFAPDLLITMPEAVRVPAVGELEYQFVILPQNFSEDRWVEAVEVRPGARGVVHHAVLYVRERDDRWLEAQPVGKPFAMPGATKSDILAVYAPGQPPSVYPAGMAKKIPAGSQLILQLHYTPNGHAVSDQTQVAMRFAKSAPKQRVLTLQLDTTRFVIPAGESGVRVSASGTLPNDCFLLGFFPHMHLRGVAFEYELIETGGRVETLLRVAPYVFHWQLAYRLASPRLLKKGSRLRCTGWYDNSANNPRNPDPGVDVRYGEQSSAEMMVGFFDVAVPANLDKETFFIR